MGQGGQVPTRDRLLAVLVATIWGVNFIAIELGVRDVPPLLFLALRFALVIFPAILFVARPAVPWQVVVKVGLFMSVGQFGLLYSAIAAGMPPGLASLVLQAQVVLTVLFAALRLHELPTRAQVAGVVLGAVGLGVVAFGRSESTPALALVLTLLGATSWACGNIVARSAGAASGLSMTVWSALVVPLPLLGLSLLLEGPAEISAAITGFTWQAGLSTLYTAGLASLIGYGIWNSLLGRHPASSVVPFTLLVPPVGMLSAWLVLGEVPNAAEATGGALLLVGVAVVALAPRSGGQPARARARGAESRI